LTYLPQWRDKYTDLLIKSLVNLKDEDEAYRLLDDLCTISEIKAMAQRLEVARLLYTNTTYSNITRDTGASTATISRVKRCLNYGSGGYKRVLLNLDKEIDNEK